MPEKGGQLSLEKVSDVDKDVLIGEGLPDSVVELPVMQGLSAVREGRFINLGGYDQDFAAALGFNSPLSIPTLLEIVVRALRTRPTATLPPGRRHSPGADPQDLKPSRGSRGPPTPANSSDRAAALLAQAGTTSRATSAVTSG